MHKVQYFDSTDRQRGQFLLIGSDEEGGELQVLDDAQTFEEAKEKTELFLNEHLCGGVVILKHLVVAYRPFSSTKES